MDEHNSCVMRLNS